MTNREFFAEIAATESLPLAIREHAQAELEKMDKRNAARASKPSKTAIANEPIKADIVALLADGGKIASEIGEALEVSTNKASALCRQLVAEGVLTEEEVKVPKAGKRKKYSLAPTEAEEVEEVTEAVTEVVEEEEI